MGIMPPSKEMEELLGSQTIPVHLYIGWLQDQKWQGWWRSSMMNNVSLWWGECMWILVTMTKLYKCSGCICQGCPPPWQWDWRFWQSLWRKSTDLLVLDTREISFHSSVDTVSNVRKIGQQQFQAITKNDSLKGGHQFTMSFITIIWNCLVVQPKRSANANSS